MTAGQVQVDRSKNKGMLIYFVVLGVAGVVVAILTTVRGWGFGGWFGASLLLFTCIASIVSMAKTGGAGLARCPVCAHENEVLHITQHRYLCCGGCKTWLEGAEHMQVVPEEHVASFPAFDLALPERASDAEQEPCSWPEGCPVCKGPVTRSVALEGTSALADVAGLVAPIMIQRVAKLRAPGCDAHDDGVAVRLESGQIIISFRSLDYWRRFMTRNGLQPR